MNNIAFIFARGGSKGLPGKNIKMLGSKPLIAHSIDIALASPRINRVIVSTDDDNIAHIAKSHGADVPFMRPASLAQDHSPEWLAWQHAIQTVIQTDGPFDAFISLPPTSPFRTVDDISRALDELERPKTDCVISVEQAHRNPYFNMVTKTSDGYATVVMSDQNNIVRRQDAPPVFDMTTIVYAARPSFIANASHLFDGRVRCIEVPKERALDIDTPFDFALAELIYEHKLNL